MSDQPNPFVNPNQRGVELPAGCKDLMDVLKMEGQNRRGRSISFGCRIQPGKLGEVKGRLVTILALDTLVALVVLHPGRGLAADLFRRPDGECFVCVVADVEKSGLKARLQSSFPGKTFVGVSQGREVVTVRTVANLSEARRRMSC